MRKNPRDFVQEAAEDPYELDLTNPPEGHKGFVTFKNPTKISAKLAFQIARSQDAELVGSSLLSPEEYEVWWAEWGDKPVDEALALLQDVQEHYGADPKESLK